MHARGCSICLPKNVGIIADSNQGTFVQKIAWWNGDQKRLQYNRWCAIFAIKKTVQIKGREVCGSSIRHKDFSRVWRSFQDVCMRLKCFARYFSGLPQRCIFLLFRSGLVLACPPGLFGASCMAHRLLRKEEGLPQKHCHPFVIIKPEQPLPKKKRFFLCWSGPRMWHAAQKNRPILPPSSHMA